MQVEIKLNDGTFVTFTKFQRIGSDSVELNFRKIIMGNKEKYRVCIDKAELLRFLNAIGFIFELAVTPGKDFNL